MNFEERRSAAMLASRIVDNFTECGIPDRWLNTILDAFGGRELCEEVASLRLLHEDGVQKFVESQIAIVKERDQLRAEVECLTAERDKAREECGHERHMRGFNSEERDKWVRKFIAGEIERDQLRASLEAARHIIHYARDACEGKCEHVLLEQALIHYDALSTDNQGADDR